MIALLAYATRGAAVVGATVPALGRRQWSGEASVGDLGGAGTRTVVLSAAALEVGPFTALKSIAFTAPGAKAWTVKVSAPNVWIRAEVNGAATAGVEAESLIFDLSDGSPDLRLLSPELADWSEVERIVRLAESDVLRLLDDLADPISTGRAKWSDREWVATIRSLVATQAEHRMLISRLQSSEDPGALASLSRLDLYAPGLIDALADEDVAPPASASLEEWEPMRSFRG